MKDLFQVYIYISSLWFLHQKTLLLLLYFVLLAVWVYLINLLIFLQICVHLVLMLSMGILCSCANLKEKEEVLFQPTTFSFDQGTYPSQTGLFEDYRIATGDVLDVLFQITTWLKQDSFPILIDYTTSAWIPVAVVPELLTLETDEIK